VELTWIGFHNLDEVGGWSLPAGTLAEMHLVRTALDQAIGALSSGRAAPAPKTGGDGRRKLRLRHESACF
jgi:hypothetical protein